MRKNPFGATSEFPENPERGWENNGNSLGGIWGGILKKKM